MKHEQPKGTSGTRDSHSGVQEIVRRTSPLPSGEMKRGILDGGAAWRKSLPTDDVSFMLVQVH